MDKSTIMIGSLMCTFEEIIFDNDDGVTRIKDIQLQSKNVTPITLVIPAGKVDSLEYYKLESNIKYPEDTDDDYGYPFKFKFEMEKGEHIFIWTQLKKSLFVDVYKLWGLTSEPRDFWGLWLNVNGTNTTAIDRLKEWAEYRPFPRQTYPEGCFIGRVGDFLSDNPVDSTSQDNPSIKIKAEPKTEPDD